MRFINQQCTRRTKDYCKAKNIPLKLKKSANEFADIHTFNVAKNENKNLNVDFVTSLDVTNQVYNLFIYILYFFCNLNNYSEIFN